MVENTEIKVVANYNSNRKNATHYQVGEAFIVGHKKYKTYRRAVAGQ